MADPLKLPMDIERGLRASIKRFFSEELDEELGELRASLVLDFFRQELGATFYNRGVSAALAFIEDRLLDLEPTCHVSTRQARKTHR